MVSNKMRLVLLLVLAAAALPQLNAANPVRYWIKFKDKKGTPYSISRPAEFLGAAAIERRVRYNIAVDETDLPVTPEYIQTIENVQNVRVIYASRWLNGVVIQLDSLPLAASALGIINSFSFVEGNKQVQRYQISEGTPDQTYNAPPPSTHLREQESTSSTALSGYSYGGSGAQIRQLQLDCLHEKGYRGQGMTIAVLDAGFRFVNTNPVFDSLRAQNGILGTRDFVAGDNDVYKDKTGTHGTMVLSCLAANKPGAIHGTAPKANYWLLTTEAPKEYLTEEYNWIRGAEFADSVGVDLLTTSLGYTEFDDPAMNHTYLNLNGRTAPLSIAATMAARKGILVLNAAGNERANPWHFISVPSDADSIIAVGAIDSLYREAAFSGVGPTSDGRIKPEFVAIGAGAWVSQTYNETFPANGTSFSTPILAGAVACFWQANKKLTNMDILRELKYRGHNAATPNNNIGWGVPRLCEEGAYGFNVYFNKDLQVLEIVYIKDFSEGSVELIDMRGRSAYKATIKVGDRKFLLSTTDIADGVYIVRIKTQNATYSRKILKN